MKQLRLIPKPKLSNGGSLQNTRQTQRILSHRKPIHLVLKSKKTHNLFRHRSGIQNLLINQAHKFNITLHTWSIQKDHVHISLKIPNRESYIKFIRAFTGLMARKLGKGLWTQRPFTRVLSGSQKDFWNLNNYIFRNEMEVFGIWKLSDRRRSGWPPTRTQIFHRF
ncbi:MAG: hypothetical protein CL676_13710 [Bdellovibrionaceae bacterium]|nr:hypothetical protein [Pseudobdellovibrionaceae bacterium]|tara:strand:- start:435 stop:932 length:498 start_codon:yes stop_codon:yes gene_type:complete